MKILFAYNRPRKNVWDAMRNGLVPDEHLYGFDHFLRIGLNVEFTDDVFGKSKSNVFFKILNDALSRRGRFVGFALSRAFELEKIASRYDLIVAWGDSTALPLLMLRRFGRVKKPIIYSSVGLAWLLMHRRWLDSFYRAIVQEASAVVHYGWAEGDVLKGRFKLPDWKVKFMPFCVDVDFFEEIAAQGISSDGDIIALGRDPQRDWGTLFKAVDGLGIEVKLICSKDAIKNLNVPKEIKWMPEVPFWKLKEVLGSAKAIVLPVKENPYTAATITALEAMAAGRAVVVSKTKAIEQGYEFESDRNIVAVKPSDAGGLREAIKRISSDFEFCKSLGTNARAKVAERYNMKVWVDFWKKTFESCYEG